MIQRVLDYQRQFVVALLLARMTLLWNTVACLQNIMGAIVLYTATVMIIVSQIINPTNWSKTILHPLQKLS